MSRSLQDGYIDDDEEEEVCPLCVEELDITDKNFRPCPCGYQICQFCYNNIKTTMNGLCPACRRQYKDENIQWKAVTQEEMLQHRQSIAQQAKKKAAAKQKEAQKREADNLSRKHLAGLRVRQKNLVYVTGMKPKTQGDRLIETLRQNQYFGQYGEILKIVVANPTKTQQPSVGIYITFNRNEDAATCIETINSSYADGSIRAQFGTTKYCSAYLRGEICNNRSCMFLHEPGDENERYTRQDLSSLNASSSQQPAQSSTSSTPAPAQQIPMAAVAQDYTDSAISPSDIDAPALPATASWADQARRASRATINSSESPLVVPANLSSTSVDQTDPELPPSRPEVTKEEKAAPSKTEQTSDRAKKNKKSNKDSRTAALDRVLEVAFAEDISFAFSTAHLSDQDREFVEIMPPLWDPRGVEKRRELKEREAEEQQRLQQEAQQIIEASLPDTEELAEGGSLALGGEPEEQIERAFSHQPQSTIHPPGFQALSNNPSSLFGGEDLSALGNKRAMTPQQHQQLLLQQFRGGASSLAPPAPAQPSSGHGRNQSRYNFAESGTTTNKPAAGLSNVKQPLASQAGNTHNFTSAQGPPPGLRATGTPPVSGGGMFGSGHGFTAGLGYGAGITRENDKIWDFHRSTQRSNIGANQMADAGKHDLPFLGQAPFGTDELPGIPATLASRPASRRATPALPPGLPIPPGFQAPIASAPAPPIADTKEVEKAQAGTNEQADGPTEVINPSSTLQIKQDEDATARSSAAPSTETPSAIKDILQEAPKAAPVISPAKKHKTSKASSKADPDITSTQKASVEAVVEAKHTPPIEAVPAKETARPAVETASLEKDEVVQDSPKRPHPGKLVIPKSVLSESKSSAVESSPLLSKAAESLTRTSRAPSLSSASVAASVNSRPATPAATANTLNSPLPRTKQPRTLRITSVATPAVEKPEPASLPAVEPTPVATKSSVATAASKIISRRPSITSTAQPGTPISERVDAFSVASASVSRASSPPAIATNKRAERKKAKKQAVQALESNVSSVEPSKAVEEVGPIVARQKKTKKPSAAPAVKPASTPSTEAKSNAQPVEVEQAAAGAVQEPEKIAPSPVRSKKAEKPKKAASPAPEPVSMPSPSPDKTSTAAAILAALESTEQLAIHTLNLLKPLASSKTAHWLLEGNNSNNTISSADLHNHLQQLTFEITRMEDELLKQGKAIRKDSGDSRISGRNLVTSKGDRYACLSKEEEDRVLELEKFISQATGLTAWGGASSSSSSHSKKSGNDRGGIVSRQTVRVEGDILEAARQGLALARTHANASGIGGGGRGADGKDSAGSSSYIDDSLRYVNAFVPPEVSDALLATTDSNGNAVAGLSLPTATTTDPQQYASETFDASAVSRSLAGLAAATQSATEALENQLGYQLGQIGLLDSVLGGVGGVSGIGLGGVGPGGRLAVKEIEKRLGEKRKETEGWEKKINALIKKNRKAVFGGN